MLSVATNLINSMPKPQSRLAELVALAQLGQPAQEDAARADNSRLQAALHVMGLQQQAQQDEAQRQMLKEHYGALLGEEQAKRQQEGDWRAKQVEHEGDATRAMLQEHLFSSLASRPDVPLDTLLQFAPTSAQPVVQALHGAAVQSGVQRMQPQVQAAYSSQHGPKLQEMLNALQGTTSPEVWGALPWDSLNASLTPTTSPTATNVDVPKGFENDPQIQAMLTQKAQSQQADTDYYKQGGGLQTELARRAVGRQVNPIRSAFSDLLSLYQ